MIQIQKELNRYIFVSTIAAVRTGLGNQDRKRKKLLDASGGALTHREKRMLEEFSIAINDNSNYVEAIFVRFSGTAMRKKLDGVLGKDNARALIAVLKIFAPRFELFWIEEKKKLQNVKRHLSNSSDLINRALRKISSLCGISQKKLSEIHIPIHLVFGGATTTSLTGWYSSFNGKNDIVIEYSPKDRPHQFLLGVIFHEFFHIALRQNTALYRTLHAFAENNSFVLQTADKKLPPSAVLEECFLSVFAPEGVLFRSMINAPVRPGRFLQKPKRRVGNMVLLRRRCAYALRNIASRYIAENKKIDKHFFKALIECIKKG